MPVQVEAEIAKLTSSLPSYDSKVVRNHAIRLGQNPLNYEDVQLGGRMLIYDSTRCCSDKIEDYVADLSNRLNLDVQGFLLKHALKINEELIASKENDYLNHDFFSAGTLVKSYLLKPSFDMDPLETPGQADMRVAVQMHATNGIDRVVQCFHEMNNAWYTQASPTRFNAGTTKPACSSCFLECIGDNLESILYDGVGDSGMISKASGGMGIDLRHIRHSQIANAGMSSGTGKMCQLYNKLFEYVDQGGGKREGACTVFVPMHHIDLLDFISMKDTQGNFTSHVDGLNTSIWTYDIFFDRVHSKGKWTVFCPAKAPSLNTVYGEEYEAEYVKMEILAELREAEFNQANETAARLKDQLLQDPRNDDIRVDYRAAIKTLLAATKGRIEHKTYNADELYDIIVGMQKKAGMPYIMHGDSINYKNMQKNRGNVNQGNLCVAADTVILTKTGHQVISELKDKEVEVWNGTGWSKVTIKQTGSAKKLITVIINNGLELTCTPEH